MNFEQYINTFKLIMQEMTTSQQYEINYNFYPGSEEINIFEEIISEEHNLNGFRIWDTFKQFYQVTMGFEFTWVYRDRTNKKYLTMGSSNIQLIYEIYEPEEQIGGSFNLYEGYRIIDRIQDENHIAVKFIEGREEPALYYYSLDTEMYHKMSLGFVEYMNLLLESRGLYQWQEFFIADTNFPINYDRANQFVADLELLFPDADSSKYRERLKLFNQNDNYNELGDRLTTIGPVSPDNFVTFYSQVGNFGVEAVVPQENYQIAPETVSRLQQWLKAGKLPDGKPLNFIYLIVPSRTAAIRVQEQAKAEGLGSVYYVDNDDNLWSPYPYTEFPDSEDVASVESSYWFNPGTLASSSPEADVDDCINRSSN